VSDLDTCLLARFPGTHPPDWLRRWLDNGLGGVALFASNITDLAQLSALTAELRSHNPAVLIAADEEGGIVTRVEARTGSSYPGNAALGAADDTGLTRRVAASMGAMIAAGGISLDLAPSADVDLNPANPVIGVRSFGSDPALVAAHTAEFVRGIQSSHVAACAKHFPGHGRTDKDSHLALPVAAATMADLRATDLLPFRAAIGAGVRAVMTAHVVYPAVDDVPATISSIFLNETLRGECGFTGVIITDALGMAAIGDDAASGAGAVRSLAAGADLLCLPESHAAQQRARDALASAIRSGDVPAHRLTESAARVRELAAWARPAESGSEATAVQADHRLGAEAARRGLLVATQRLPLSGAPYVLDAGGRMSRMLNDTASSLLGVLRGRNPAVAGIRISEPPDSITGAAAAGQPDGAAAQAAHAAWADALIERAAGRSLVLAVADAHRRPWQAELVRQVLARRPDAVVVGTGTAHDAVLASGSYVGTRGAGRANLEAAADILLG
jgi:beta-N-acetylhexosaminidase